MQIKFIIAVVISVFFLVGCAEKNSPELNQNFQTTNTTQNMKSSLTSKEVDLGMCIDEGSSGCGYHKIKGKAFKYSGSGEYMYQYFSYNPNIEDYKQMNTSNYSSLIKYNFKVLETGLTTSITKKYLEFLSPFRYTDDIFDNAVYRYDSSSSSKIITEDCKVYYTNGNFLSAYIRDIKNVDKTELSTNDLSIIFGEKGFKKLDFESEITYDKFTKDTKITTPLLKNILIRGNYQNNKVVFIQLYANLYFDNSWGFIKNAVDTDSKQHNVTRISTDTSCTKTGCTLTETVGIDLSLDFLKKNQNGFEIKAYGTREKIITVPSVMVKSFLKASKTITK